jgi:hypothetical protein
MSEDRQMGQQAARKYLFGGLTVLAVVLLVLAFWMFRGVQEKAWYDYARTSISQLAVFVESYNAISGRYPSSFSEMLKEPEFATNRIFRPAVAGMEGTRYSYALSNASFSIVASRQATWLLGSKDLVVQFRFGEGINSR